MYFVYVLYSEKDGGLYIGYTTDISRRVSEHNDGDTFSTADRRPLMLAYYEAYFCQEDALGRERFLKSGAGRTFLKKQMKTFFAAHPPRESK